MTYSAGCTLMLLAALDDEEHLEWAEELTDFLVETQGRGGSMGLWAYPGSSWDFSNTQYAALGLRAAHQLGVRIPKRTWELLIEDTLSRQVKAKVIDPPPGVEGRTGTGYRLAPFCYRDPDANGGTGSMTTAGIGCLAIASRLTGYLGSFCFLLCRSSMRPPTSAAMTAPSPLSRRLVGRLTGVVGRF